MMVRHLLFPAVSGGATSAEMNKSILKCMPSLNDVFGPGNVFIQRRDEVGAVDPFSDM